MSQQTRLDITDLRIMKLLSRDSRTPYRNIASAVGIMPSAVKERINKMVSNEGCVSRIEMPADHSSVSRNRIGRVCR